MSNKVTDIIKKVFVNLEEHIPPGLPIYQPKDMFISKNRIPEINTKLMDILKYTKYKKIIVSNNMTFLLLLYDNNYYIVYSFDLECPDLGEIIIAEEFIVAFGTIAISENILVSHEDASFKIYNNIFASSINEFDFNDISCFYRKYTIIKLNEIKFKEDIYRFTGLILINNLYWTSNVLTLRTYKNLLYILNLESSKSISMCIIRCLDSALLDHCFLEIYRCIEYLFYIQTAIDISDKYSTADLFLLIDLVYNKEIINTERDSLYALIKNINDTYCIDEFYDFLESNNYISPSTNKHHSISEHIYDLRCKTAHLKYKHEYIIFSYKWDKTIEYFSALVYAIYSSLNRKILYICKNNDGWDNIENIWKK